MHHTYLGWFKAWRVLHGWEAGAHVENASTARRLEGWVLHEIETQCAVWASAGFCVGAVLLQELLHWHFADVLRKPRHHQLEMRGGASHVAVPNSHDRRWPRLRYIHQFNVQISSLLWNKADSSNLNYHVCSSHWKEQSTLTHLPVTRVHTEHQFRGHPEIICPYEPKCSP